MPAKEKPPLPTRIVAITRNISLLVIRQLSSLLHRALSVARNLTVAAARKASGGWKRYVREGGAHVKFGWAAGAAYMELLDPNRVSFKITKGRRRVDAKLFKPHPRTAVILAFGQSNIANEGDPNGLHVPDHGVYNFNIFDGKIYVARCPLLGTTCARGNFTTRLGDLLVQRGIYDKVLLVPVGHGGTYITDWAPGGSMNFRLMFALELLRRRGIAITHALFQQGEAEGYQSNADGAAWARNFEAMVEGVRLLGMQAPIYVAQCSICRCNPSPTIRAAQRGVVNPAKSIYPGPDTDTIVGDGRWDGCHFSTAGLKKAAELWFDAITIASITGHNVEQILPAPQRVVHGAGGRGS
ncbi:MAG TPA: sialate O-acetylesterase [Burkholderiales bacterium]|nr:sialate O-acetylesterase [Burkholderiales bacterium]